MNDVNAQNNAGGVTNTTPVQSQPTPVTMQITPVASATLQKAPITPASASQATPSTPVMSNTSNIPQNLTPAASSNPVTMQNSTTPTPPPTPVIPQKTPITTPGNDKPSKKGLLASLFAPRGAKNSTPDTEASLAKLALHSIADGVIIIDKNNQISLINPAAVALTSARAPEVTLGLELMAVLNLETIEGGPVPLAQTALYQAILQGKSFTSREYVSVTEQNHKFPIAINVIPAHGHKIITFRDITKELEEEGEQAEFISTASHEMRTPVASIEGYIGLAMNPQTATIDDRARQYLDAAHSASQHLGRLFKDLLDVTKLDDKKLKVHAAPIELTDYVQRVVNDHTTDLAKKSLKLTFGTETHDKNHLAQPVYVMVDVDFLREILDNLIENAEKYTPEGGAIWINVRPDGDEALINITDTGMGIAPDDLTHIFQKFYRADNSQTRTIGGTGLGLYIVKQRVEAMGGRVWAESAFGDGSTFYVAFPRMGELDYQRAKLAYENNQAMGLGAAANKG